MAVRCKICGGSHPSWECKQQDPQLVTIDVADARRVPAERAALRRGEAVIEAAEPTRTAPWYQPPGVCPSCDRRRAHTARSVAKRRERE